VIWIESHVIDLNAIFKRRQATVNLDALAEARLHLRRVPGQPSAIEV
jgi:hypothetical protein